MATSRLMDVQWHARSVCILSTSFALAETFNVCHVSVQIIVLLNVVALTALLADPARAGEVASSSAPQTLLVGIGARGVFDPSVTEDPETRRLWMSYSSFDVSSNSQSGVNLRIASSEDGATW